MINKKIILTVVILVLVIVDIFFGVSYFFSLKSLRIAEKQLSTQQNNVKIVKFTQLFISKVLKAEKEVSFEDRLKLENTVRELNDNEVLVQWERFTASKTEAEAQFEVKNLLELLVKKYSY